MRLWYPPLAIATSVQVSTSLADVAVPVLGPVVTTAAGVPAAYVGYYASAVAAGAIACYLLGAGVIRRVGPVRTLQIGAGVCAGSLLLVLAGNWWLVVTAGLLIGLGLATNTSAGSVLLHHSVPSDRRQLAFAVKQAGVPVGTILAGVSLPFLAGLWTWQLSLLAASAVGGLVILFVHSFGELDRANDGAATAGHWIDLGGLREVADGPIRRLMIVGGLLAVAQGNVNAFLVTYLSDGLGHPLAVAGGVYSFLHLAGIPGRVASGWLADRPSLRGKMLTVIGAASAATIALLALLTQDTPIIVVALSAAAVGLVVGSWNSVILADASAAAAGDRIAETTGVVAIGTFAGFILGPLLFAVLVSASGSYGLALTLTAVSAAIAPMALPRPARARRMHGRS